jgi:hypothetical protein
VYPTPVPAARAATTTSLTTSSSTTVASGDTVDLQATASTTGGLVQFEEDGQPLGSPVEVNGEGVADLQTTLENGEDTVTAMYVGDGGSAPSVSNAITFTVGTLSSTTSISAPDGTTVAGDTDATLDVAVSGSGPTPSGPVTIDDGTKVLESGVTLNSNGEATAHFPLPAGTSKVDAVYAGAVPYGGSTSNKITFATTTPYAPAVSGTAKYKTSKSGTKVSIAV